MALAKGELGRAKRRTEELLEKYEELKLSHFKPGVLYLRGKIELASGNKEAAYRSLCNALALSDEMGAHRQVWEMCAALSRLETERGNESAAQQLKERARNEAMMIAEHAGTSELSAIFLSPPDLQLILSAE